MVIVISQPIEDRLVTLLDIMVQVRYQYPVSTGEQVDQGIHR